MANAKGMSVVLIISRKMLDLPFMASKIGIKQSNQTLANKRHKFS